MAVGHTIHLIDWFTSDANRVNFEIMRLNGFPNSTIFRIYATNALTWFIPALLIVTYHHDQVMPYFSAALLLQIVVIMAASDVAFFFSHRLLHRSLPATHKFHHCVRYPTLMANLLFDPVDLAVEFSGPVLVAYFLSLHVFNDAFCFVVSAGCIGAWYAADHDEYLKLPHWYHHVYINSIYGIYTSFGEHDSLDRVRTSIH
eukprot:TRINITY_DN6499_c0_g1_i2.p2 TRINITY_DN6499_c0_g1~~TRINITY_DN6499_c0_g1_i2.p2  ORF type:complete len:201 (+),score=47.04 TRINITY_DN6499_c0_g1_i2:463-1065(+)